MLLEDEKTRDYKEAESNIICEINKYIESCIKGMDLNKEFSNEDLKRLSNILPFTESILLMHQKRLKLNREVVDENNF